MKSDIGYPLPVALQGRELALGGHVPQLNAPRRAHHGQPLPVWMPANVLIGQVPNRQAGDERATGGLVHGNGSGREVTYRQELAVRAISQGEGQGGERKTVDLLPRAQIDTQYLPF